MLCCLCLVLAGAVASPHDDSTLIARLGSSNASERESAARALAARGPSVTAAIMDAVSNYHDASNIPAFEAAVQALAAMGPAALPQLRHYLREGRDNTRLAAVAALKVMAPPPVAAAPELAQALWDPLALVRGAAEEALRRMGAGAAPELARILVGSAVRPTWDLTDARGSAAGLIVDSGQSETMAVVAPISAAPPAQGAAAHFFLGAALRAAAQADQEAAGQRSKLELSRQHLQRCLDLAAGSVENRQVLTRNCLTEILWVEGEQGDRQRGDRHAHALLDLAPSDVRAASVAAAFYRRVGRIADGETVLKQLLEVKGRTAEACAALGEFYASAVVGGPPDYDAAIQAYEECETARPRDPEAATRVAGAFMAKAAFDPKLGPAERVRYAERGIEAADRALKLDPENADALMHKSGLYRTKAKYMSPGPAADALAEEARRLSRRSIELRGKREHSAGTSGPPGTM